MDNPQGAKMFLYPYFACKIVFCLLFQISEGGVQSDTETEIPSTEPTTIPDETKLVRQSNQKSNNKHRVAFDRNWLSAFKWL